MNKEKIIENFITLSISAGLLHFFIFPGLKHDSFIVNVLSLTGFFMLVVYAILGKDMFKNEE